MLVVLWGNVGRLSLALRSGARRTELWKDLGKECGVAISLISGETGIPVKAKFVCVKRGRVAFGDPRRVQGYRRG